MHVTPGAGYRQKVGNNDLSRCSAEAMRAAAAVGVAQTVFQQIIKQLHQSDPGRRRRSCYPATRNRQR